MINPMNLAGLHLRSRKLSLIKGLAGLIVGLVILIASPQSPAAQETLRIAAISNAALVKKGVAVLQEVYRHAGLHAVFEYMPAARSIKTANSGRMDGEALRSKDAAAKYPNLVRVAVPVAKGELVAWALHDIGPINESFDITKFRVALMNGDVLAQRIAGEARVYNVRSYNQAAGMLLKNRIDFVLAWRRSFTTIVSASPKFSQIRPVSKDLFVTEGYHYLHKKHTNLVPRLERSLRELWANGRMDEMWRDTP
jgi:polar amino acid transport system substrate-binding protein